MVFILFHGINALWNFNIFPLIMCSKHYHVVFGRSISNSWARTCLVYVCVCACVCDILTLASHIEESIILPSDDLLQLSHPSNPYTNPYHSENCSRIRFLRFFILHYIITSIISCFFHSPSCLFHVSYRALINIFDFPIHFHIHF